MNIAMNYYPLVVSSAPSHPHSTYSTTQGHHSRNTGSHPLMPISHPLALATSPGPSGMPLRRPKHPIFCANCGGIGHIYKNCNHPVTSYGIICYRLVLDPRTNSICPLYLMVQRKDSMSYVEFLRGKYQLENKSYLMKLFSNMTKEEHVRIQLANDTHIPFEKLWKDLWQVHDCRSFEKEFLEARTKYDLLKQGYYLSGPSAQEGENNGERDRHNKNSTMVFFSLKELLRQAPATHDTTEWGFPKGRRNINEDDIHCALREFSEETGYMIGQIKIHMDVKPMEEIFSGTNRVRYKHVYYLAQLAEGPPPMIPSGILSYESSIGIMCDARKEMRGRSSISEIRDVKWFTYHDAQAVLRNYNIERKELFRRVNHNVLKNLYAYSKRFTTHAIAP